MSVTTETNRTAELVTDGSETEFSFDMLIHAETWLEVYYKPTGGSYSQLTLKSHYTVAFNALGGSITTIGGSSPYAAGTLLIIRRPPFTELANWLYVDNHSEIAHQMDFDQKAAVDIYMLELLKRAVKFAVTSSTTGITFPEPEANKLLGWNSDGDDLENKPGPVIIETENWIIREATDADVTDVKAHLAGNLLIIHKTNGTRREYGA